MLDHATLKVSTQVLLGNEGALGRKSGTSAPLHGVITLFGTGKSFFSPWDNSKVVVAEEIQYR